MLRIAHRNGVSLAMAVTLVVGIATTAYGQDPTSVKLDNGVVGEGHLNVELDEYGTFGDWTPAWVDDFFPCPDADGNAPPEASATFMTALFIFVDSTDGNGGGSHRGVLSGHGNIVDTYQNDNTRPANLFPYVISNHTGVDGDLKTTSMVGISDVAGGGGDIDLEVAVTNTVGVGADGPPPDNACSATLVQSYVFTNVGANTITFLVNKHIDEDLLWAGQPFPNATDDRVGVDFGVRGYPTVYAQDGDRPTASMLESFTRNPLDDPEVTAFYYYGAKQGIQPPDGTLPFNSGGDCPMFDFGTDFQIWDNYGVPRCWRNRVATVGTNVQGITVDVVGDTHIGTQIEITLGVGASYDLEYETSYGFRPVLPTFSAPTANGVLVNRGVDSEGLGEFLIAVRNVNTGGESEPPAIDTLFVDVERGQLAASSAGGVDAEWTLLPDGWSAENCTGFDANGHALFRLNNDSGLPITPAATNATKFRLRLRTNDATEDTNPSTGVEVDALTAVLTVSQDNLDHIDADWTSACATGDYSYGPRVEPPNGLWGIPVQATAFLPVPSLSSWAKGLLMTIVAGLGVMLVLRSRRPIAA